VLFAVALLNICSALVATPLIQLAPDTDELELELLENELEELDEDEDEEDD
jgi:hypothetical protein